MMYSEKQYKELEQKYKQQLSKLKKDSSNSCKPSSTNGFKKVIQNNRVKSGYMGCRVQKRI